MTPYMSTPSGVLYCGDSLDIMRTIPDASVDVLITDPPYSSGGQFRGDRAQSSKTKYVNDVGKYTEFMGDNRDQRSFLFWSTMWVSQCYRALKPGSIACIFTDWRQLPVVSDAFQAGGFTWRGVAVWDKTEATRPVLGRFRNQCEYIVWGTKGARPATGGFFQGYAEKAWSAARSCMPLRSLWT